jgi:hypothetical protein
MIVREGSSRMEIRSLPHDRLEWTVAAQFAEFRDL